MSRFDWVRDSAIGEAACVTVVSGADLADVIRAFGGDPNQAVQADLAAAVSDPDTPTAVVRRVGGSVLVVENNGFEGSRPEVLTRLRGTAVSAFWNVNAVTWFSYAVDGTVMSAFEATFPENRVGAEPDAVQAEAAGLPWADKSVDLVSVMLALLARLTGFTLQREHLDGPVTLVPLVPWPDDVPDEVSPRYESLTYSDPVVSYALQHADEHRLRSAARAAVWAAAEAAGLDDDPTLRAVAEGRAGARERAVLDQMARELSAAARWPEFRAVQAARAALASNALVAAFRAITEAGYGVQATGGDETTLREAVVAALGNPVPPAGSGQLSATSGPQPWDRYGWIDQHWLGWAAHLTFFRGGEHVPATYLSARVRGPVRLERGPTWTLRVGDWTLLLEVGESPKPLLDYLVGLTDGGEAVHVNWSARGQAHFWHVVDRELRSSFNVYQPHLVRGSTPSELDALRAGLTFPLAGRDGGRQAPTLLALAERITGVAFTPELLDAQWRG